ncbi:MAG TPA: YihY/virulence factor BrkB family protein [Patescibacteria group bacterium]|nr:YihY/virulence factor BrkB family protein [Patescibacteria group bacterium]
MKVSAGQIWELIKKSGSEWVDDKCMKLSAALSYYTVFSLAPLLLIVISIAAAIFGYEAARGQITDQLQGLMGAESAEFVETLLKNAYKPEEGLMAAILGGFILLLGATGVFAELQESLNMIWNVQPKPENGFMGIIKDRILSFGMIVVIGFLLLVSLVISALLTGFQHVVEQWVALPAWLMVGIGYLISFAVVTVMFAMIFKVLPDVKLKWHDVWIGAVITAILFAIGKVLIGLYIGNSAVGSTYGAAGSLAVLFVWIYYSGLILFFGAEFTQVYAENYGSGIVPKENAEFIQTPHAIKKEKELGGKDDLKVESKGGKSDNEKKIEEKAEDRINKGKLNQDGAGAERIKVYDPDNGYKK